MSVFLIFLAMAIWGVVHSILASHFVKDILKGFLGGMMRFYRLGYNALAVITFTPILYLTYGLPNWIIYQVPSPWNLLMIGGQLLSAILLLIAVLQTDTLSFVGVRQLFEDEGPGQLVTRGLYRVVRHPLYTFSLLFIWLTPTMSQNSLTLYIGVTIYVLVGAYFEERKLLRDFGDAYAEYRRKTPMLIPGLVIGGK